MTTVIFHDFSGLENFFFKFKDFPGCVGTYYLPCVGVKICPQLNQSASRLLRRKKVGVKNSNKSRGILYR